MDSSTNYLAQANKDANDVQKSNVEAPDEEIVVFANGKNSTNDPKKALGAGQDAHDQSGADSNAPNGKGSSAADPDSLTDAFKSLNVNGKPTSDPKYDYGLDSYRANNKFPSIAVSSTPGDTSASADWHQQPNKVGRKAEDAYGNGPSLYRPLNASASDFQHRGAPGAAGGYPAYGAPSGAYGAFQPPPIHGQYLAHGYDAFGLSPTLTEPAVAGGANGGGASSGNGSGGRFVPRGAGGDHNGVGLTLNGLSGSGTAQGPYSPIPLSPSPLSLNPYAAHHHAAQMHMNGHQYGAYLPAQGGPGGAAGGPAGAKSEVPGSSLGTSPGSAAPGQAGNGPTANGPGAGANAARGYPPGTLVNVQGIQYSMPGQGPYYDESTIYAQYGAPPPHLSHTAHGLHPNAAVHHQYGMNVGAHPGTPQMGAYGAYIHGPMVGVPGGTPGMLPVPNGVVANGHAGVNGAGQGQGQGQGNQNGVPANQGVNGAVTVASGAPGGVLTVVNGLTLLNGVPQPNADGTGPSANNRKLGLYKTELCRSWEEKGSCRYGPKCQFAHGEEEIRKVARHPKYKTEICRVSIPFSFLSRLPQHFFFLSQRATYEY